MRRFRKVPGLMAEPGGMTVVMDAYWLGGGTQSLHNAVTGLIHAWAETFPQDQIVAVASARYRPDQALVPSNVLLKTTRVWPQALVATLVIPMWSLLIRADATFTHNFAALAGRRRLVLLHDVLFLSNPEWFTRRENGYFRWMTRLAPRAHRVLATTSNESRRMKALTGLDSSVIGFGLGESLLGGQPTRVPGLEPGGFVLTVGRLNIRKNLGRMLEGALRSGVVDRGLPFVVVGEASGEAPEIPATLTEAVAEERVRFLGSVDDSSMGWLLRHCAVFLFLSLDEGFGLPPVEAAALGARVIASDRPVFRETLGDAAVFVDPTDVGAIARAIRTLVETRADRDGRIAGEVRARHEWRLVVGRIRDIAKECSG